MFCETLFVSIDDEVSAKLKTKNKKKSQKKKKKKNLHPLTLSMHPPPYVFLAVWPLCAVRRRFPNECGSPSPSRVFFRCWLSSTDWCSPPKRATTEATRAFEEKLFGFSSKSLFVDAFWFVLPAWYLLLNMIYHVQFPIQLCINSLNQLVSSKAFCSEISFVLSSKCSVKLFSSQSMMKFQLN